MNMPADKKIVTSMGISFAMHAFLLLCAAYIWVGILAPAPQHKEEKMLHVKMTPDNLALKRMLITRAGSEGPVKNIPGFGGLTSDILTPGLEGAPGVPAHKEEDLTGLIDRKSMEEKLELPDKRAIDRLKEKAKVRPVRTDITNPDENAMPIPPEGELAASPEAEYLSEEFVKEMPGFTPSAAQTGLGLAAYKPFHGSGAGGTAGGGSGGGRRDIAEYIVADVAIYKDPADGLKYFRITIMPGKDSDKFKVLSKEISFLIDCSLSINSDRMEEFKKGFSYCLDHLGKDDTFNVISFKESTQMLSPFPLANTPATIARAKHFIATLAPTNSTDVYSAFSDVIENPPAHLPSYIIFVSDGKPTAGIKDSRDIIARINRSNKGIRPIFSFSGGARTNRYLLDFIAYCNRGWAEYVDRAFYISGGLEKLFVKINDPILINLRYRFSGIATDEIYPKTLPDLYRGAAFTVFGRYDAENEFSMQLSGDTDKERIESIFSDAFANARQGSREIARQWALNKVYYMIGKLTEKKGDPELIKQIQELCAKFGIKTPYSEGIQ